MKGKKTKWSSVPWTPWEKCVVDPTVFPPGEAPSDVWRNSRYQVGVWFREAPEPFGRYMHLSIKVHDKQAWHDWRDLQRIKNELVDIESEAVELYPAESRLVDTANQYHLFVFRPGWRFPFGFPDRLVAAPGETAFAPAAVQRPFDGAQAGPVLSAAELQSVWDKVNADARTALARAALEACECPHGAFDEPAWTLWKQIQTALEILRGQP